MPLLTTQFTFAREMPVFHFRKTQQKYIRFQPLAGLMTKSDYPRSTVRKRANTQEQGIFIR
jgi:hypothetical protein